MRSRGDVVFHILDFLIKLVVLVKQARKVMIGSFQLGNQVTKLGKHKNSISLGNWAAAATRLLVILQASFAVMLELPAQKTHQLDLSQSSE